LTKRLVGGETAGDMDGIDVEGHCRNEAEREQNPLGAPLIPARDTVHRRVENPRELGLDGLEVVSAGIEGQQNGPAQALVRESGKPSPNGGNAHRFVSPAPDRAARSSTAPAKLSEGM
jgi:hypothetical protein